MKFNLNSNDIQCIINLIDKFGNNNPESNHVKNVLMNRRGSKSYSKSQLIDIIKGYKPEYDLDNLKEMDDRKLYKLALKLELEVNDIDF